MELDSVGKHSHTQLRFKSLTNVTKTQKMKSDRKLKKKNKKNANVNKWNCPETTSKKEIYK